jgi:hypothetical protein
MSRGVGPFWRARACPVCLLGCAATGRPSAPRRRPPSAGPAALTRWRRRGPERCLARRGGCYEAIFGSAWPPRPGVGPRTAGAPPFFPEGGLCLLFLPELCNSFLRAGGMQRGAEWVAGLTPLRGSGAGAKPNWGSARAGHRPCPAAQAPAGERCAAHSTRPSGQTQAVQPWGAQVVQRQHSLAHGTRRSKPTHGLLG